MKIYPMDHSGVFIVTKKRAFLFGYIGGKLPEYNVPLTVLVSHRHEDHYNPKIFELGADEIILSSDIPPVDGTILMTPYETRKADYTLSTVGSTDEGVAYLLETEGLRLFFAGDLNDWYWADEDTHEDMVFMERAFRHEIDRIGHADVLFFPVDARLESEMTKGLDYATRKLRPRAVLPIHTWGEDERAEKAVAETGVHVLTRERSHELTAEEACAGSPLAPAATILLTGFEPFDGETENPSGLLVRALAEEHRTGLVTAVLPVAFDRAALALRALIETHRPDRVVLLGQAGGRNRVTAEMVAVNFRDARIPDNDGMKPYREKILKSAPDAYLSTAPVYALVDRMRADGIPAAVSMTAGTYVCNELYFSALHWMAGHGETVFVHLPYLPAQATEKDAPSMDLATMRRAVEHVL